MFLLEYSGVDPRILKTEDLSSSSKQGFNPLSVIPPGVVPADIGQVSLLATIPLITNGVASYLLIPLSVAIGRRPVLILTGASAWIGGVVAGFSANLGTHLVGRALQGLGAGTVEALIPLIVQDTMFIHQRNKAMSAVVSSQGIFIIALGFAAPFFAVNYTWRILYYLTSGLGFIAWVLLIFFLPETRWMRSSEELSTSPLTGMEARSRARDMVCRGRLLTCSRRPGGVPPRAGSEATNAGSAEIRTADLLDNGRLLPVRLRVEGGRQVDA